MRGLATPLAANAVPLAANQIGVLTKNYGTNSAVDAQYFLIVFGAA